MLKMRQLRIPHTVAIILAISSPLSLVPDYVIAQQRTPLEIPQIVSSARGSLVLIKAYDNSGLIQQGSGFRIFGGRIATNAHVVANATRIEVFNDGGQLLGTAQYAEAVSTSVDIAILPRLGQYGIVSPLSPSIPAVGERIVVLGAPEGLTNTVSDGIVSAMRTVDGQSLIQISAPISPGSSGGPVLNMNGEVIGVSVATYREGQNLNFAVPVADLFAVASSPPGTVAFPKQPAQSRRVSDSSEPDLTGELHAGSPVSGELGAGSFVLKDGRAMDMYLFSGRAGQTISISARSDDFDTVLSIARFIGDSIDIVDTDDDGGGDSNSMINATLPVSAKYVITIVAHEESLQKRGQYVLDLREGRRPRIASTAASSTTSNTDRWALVGTSETRTTEIDKRSIRSAGSGLVRFWARVKQDPPETNSEGVVYDTSITQEEVNCNTRLIRLSSPYEYFDGKVVWSPRDSSMSTWRVVVPGSVGERIVEFVCQAVRSNRR